MASDRLIHMANQIGSFFATQPRIDAAAAVADHLRKFWDPRMRAAIIAHAAQGGGDLAPHVREAVRLLAADEEAKGATGSGST